MDLKSPCSLRYCRITAASETSQGQAAFNLNRPCLVDIDWRKVFGRVLLCQVVQHSVQFLLASLHPESDHLLESDGPAVTVLPQGDGRWQVVASHTMFLNDWFSRGIAWLCLRWYCNQNRKQQGNQD